MRERRGSWRAQGRGGLAPCRDSPGRGPGAPGGRRRSWRDPIRFWRSAALADSSKRFAGSVSTSRVRPLLSGSRSRRSPPKPSSKRIHCNHNKRSAVTSATASAVARRILRNPVRSASGDRRPEARGNALDPLSSEALAPSVRSGARRPQACTKARSTWHGQPKERPWGRPPHLGVTSSGKTAIISSGAHSEG